MTDGAIVVSFPLDLPWPYLLFLRDADDTTVLKTGLGLRDWTPALCIGECADDGARATLGLSAMRPGPAFDELVEACPA